MQFGYRFYVFTFFWLHDGPGSGKEGFAQKILRATLSHWNSCTLNLLVDKSHKTGTWTTSGKIEINKQINRMFVDSR